MSNLKIGKMIIRSLLKKPATLMYPIVQREYPDMTRGHISVNMEDCILCGICQRKCPTDAIEVDREAKTWQIKRMQCVQCNCCVDVCPKKCLINEATYTAPDLVKIVDTFEKPETKETKDVSKEKLRCDDTCIFCTLCEKKCPLGAITVNREAKTWEVDHDKCTRCGLCIEVCTKKSLRIE